MSLSKVCSVFWIALMLVATPLPGKIDTGRAWAEAGISKQENVLNPGDQRSQKEFFVPKKRLSAREWVQKGSEFLASKDYENARRAFSNAIELNEGFLYLSNKKAAMHMRYGNTELAGNELKKIEDLEALLGYHYYQRGVVLREWGKVQEAIFDFDRAIRLDATLSVAYLERGRAYQEMGDYRQAIDNYNLVLKKDPQNKTAYSERSSAYMQLEFFPLAILDCAKAIEIDPQYARAYLDRGISYQRIGNDHKGIEDFKIAAGLGSPEAQEILKAKGVQW